MQTELTTTRERAEAGQVLSTADDILTVATRLRCQHNRRVCGFVLHLDRSQRGLGPLWFAELLQADLGLMLSAASKNGQTSNGDRLAVLDAVELPAHHRSPASLAFDCGDVDVLHLSTAPQLIHLGRKGLEYRRRREARGSLVRPWDATVGEVVSYLTPTEKLQSSAETRGLELY
jgi:hypothetical protein